MLNGRCCISNVKSRIFSDGYAQNSDCKKSVTGLVLQGGGMRGIFSMACLYSLSEMGFSNAFDHIIGVSAGAINGAYFISRQTTEAVRVYLNYLTDNKFINRTRFNKIIDIDYLVDNVLRKKNEVNIDVIRDSLTKLHVCLTEKYTKKCEFISYNSAEESLAVDIYSLFKATSALPILYGNDVKINDCIYVDGGASNFLPIDKAVELGCTDIVVVLTTPMSLLESSWFKYKYLFQSVVINGFNGGAYRRYLSLLNFMKQVGLQNKSKSEQTLDKDLDKDNINISVICPVGLQKYFISRLDTNIDRLTRYALLARNITRMHFGYNPAIDNPFNSYNIQNDSLFLRLIDGIYSDYSSYFKHAY